MLEVPFQVSIADGAIRARIEWAAGVLAGVHPLPAAPPIPVTEEPLGPGEAAIFRVWSNGVVDIAVDPAQSEALEFDFIHEVGHLVDWILLPPPDEFSTATIPDELVDWSDAVSRSQARQRLQRMKDAPQMIEVTLASGLIVMVEEAEWIVDYLIRSEELFARSYCQYVAERSSEPLLLAQLVEALENHYPEHWTTDDFRPIHHAMHNLIGAP